MNVRRHWQCAATARIVFQGKFYPCGRTCARNDLELRFKPVKRGCAQIYFCGRFNFINKLPSFLLVERRYTIGTKPHRRQSQQVKKGYSQRQSKDLATSCPSTPPRRPNPRGHPARATTEDEDRSIVAAAVVIPSRGGPCSGRFTLGSPSEKSWPTRATSLCVKKGGAAAVRHFPRLGTSRVLRRVNILHQTGPACACMAIAKHTVRLLSRLLLLSYAVYYI